jgi:hypothetical protein
MYPYRDIGALTKTVGHEPSIDRSTRAARMVVLVWAILRVVVAVAQHRLPVEGATAALLVVLLATRPIEALTSSAYRRPAGERRLGV